MVLNQSRSTRSHSHGPLGNVERIEHDLRTHLTLVLALDPETVQRGDLLCRRLGAVVQRLENNGLNQRLGLVWVRNTVFNLVPQRLTKRLHRWQEDPSILAVHGAAHRGRIVHKVIHPVWLQLSVDIDAVHAQHLNQELTIQRIARNVVEVNPRGRVVVPDANPEVFRAQSESAQRIDVFHHEVPQGSDVTVLKAHPRHRALQHLQDKGARSGVTVLTQRTHLVGLAIQRVFVCDRQHLRIVERLPEAHKAQTVVVGELRGGQTPGVTHPLIVNALVVNRRTIWPCVRRDGRSSATEPHDIGVAGHVDENVVVGVVRRPIEVDADVRAVSQFSNGQVRRHVIRVLTNVREREDVPDVLRIGLGVHHIDLDPRDARSRVDHGQALQGVVITVPEILTEEVVPVGFVIVRSDVKFLGLCAPLNLDFLALTLLLAEYRGVVHLAPLGLELRTKQRLTALDQRALQRHADVARLDVFQDVILFSLEADVHLVLEVKRGLRIVVGSEVDLVANVAIDGQLNALVKIKSGDGPVALRQTGVLGPAVTDTEIQFGRTLGLDLNLV